MARQVQRIVTYDVDRLARRIADLEEWFELLQEAECELHTVRDGLIEVDLAEVRAITAYGSASPQTSKQGVKLLLRTGAHCHAFSILTESIWTAAVAARSIRIKSCLSTSFAFSTFLRA